MCPKHVNPADFLIDMLDDMKGKTDDEEANIEDISMDIQSSLYERALTWFSPSKTDPVPKEKPLFPQKYEFSQSEECKSLQKQVNNKGCSSEGSRIERQLV